MWTARAGPVAAERIRSHSQMSATMRSGVFESFCQLVSHDRPWRGRPSDLYEAEPGKGRGVSRARRAWRPFGGERIGLQPLRAGRFGSLDCCLNQRRRDAMPSMALANVKTRDRPYLRAIRGSKTQEKKKPRQIL